MFALFRLILLNCCLMLLVAFLLSCVLHHADILLLPVRLVLAHPLARVFAAVKIGADVDATTLLPADQCADAA